MLRLQPVPFALVLLLLGLAAARFLHLEADFPTSITRSGELYTDEGWYTKAAVQAVRTGNWYAQEDFTTAVNLPVGQIAYFLWFKLFGVSLCSARALTACCSLSIAAALWWVARRFCDGWAALAAPLLVLGNHVFFAYSRLAQLELPMLALASVALALLASAPAPLSLARVIAAALVFLLALLTKTSALFMLPGLVLLVWLWGGTRAARCFKVSITVAIPLLGTMAYAGLAKSAYPTDYEYFVSLNVTQRLLGTTAALRNLVPTLGHAIGYQPFLMILCLCCVAVGLRCTRQRHNPVFLACLCMLAGHLGLLALTAYQPARYFLSLVIPSALLVALTLHAARARGWKSELVWSLALAACFAYGGSRIVSYLRAPQYSFLAMAKSIGEQMRRELAPRVLMGNFADSIALAEPLAAVNSEKGPAPLIDRLRRYAPAFYVSLGPHEDPVWDKLQDYYDVRQVREYEVLGNYKGSSVHLLQLREKAAPRSTVAVDE